MKEVMYMNVADYDNNDSNFIDAYAHIEKLDNGNIRVTTQLAGDDKSGELVIDLNRKQVRFLYGVFSDACEMVDGDKANRIKRIYDAALREWRKPK